MRRRPIALYVFALVCFLAGYIFGLQGAPSPAAHAQTSTRPAVVQLSGRGTATQAWMAAPFCLDPAWWDGILCSEAKGPADAPAPGFVYKLDLPLPACMAFIGKDALGRWRLSAVPAATGQCPGDNFTLVSGPCLVQPAGYDTPAPPGSTPPPAATSSPTPTATPSLATATKPAVTSTSTPPASPSPMPIPLPTLSPAQLRSFHIVCEPPGTPLKVILWGGYELAVNVDRDLCGPLYVAIAELLRRLSEMEPITVEVRP